MSPDPRTTARRPMNPQAPPPRGRVHIRVDRCKGCEFCVEFCPQQVLKLSSDFNPKGFHYPIVAKDECINCNLCVFLCPDFAIFSRPIVARPAAQQPLAPTASGARPGTSSQGPQS